MSFYNSMGKDVSVDVLKWKKAYEATQPQEKKVEVATEKAVITKKTTSKNTTTKTASIAPVVVEDVFNPVAVGSDADTNL